MHWGEGDVSARYEISGNGTGAAVNEAHGAAPDWQRHRVVDVAP